MYEDIVLICIMQTTFIPAVLLLNPFFSNERRHHGISGKTFEEIDSFQIYNYL